MATGIRLSDHVYLVGDGAMGLSETYDCHVYLVDAGSSLFLIDAGAGIEPALIENNMRALGLGPARLSHVLLTHCHSDHAGGAHYFHEEYDVPICGGHMTAQRVSSGEERLLGLDIARPEGVYPPDYKFAATPVSVVFKDGDDLTIGECSVQVLETPGHSSDSTCYLVTLAEGVALFGGDTLRTDGKIPLLNMFDSELAAYRGSVKRLAGQSFDALYPGHGIFVLSGARRVAEELDQQLSHSIYLPGVIS